MAEPYQIKQHDTDPPLEAQLLDAAGTPVVVNAGDTVAFRMGPKVAGVKTPFTAAAVVTDATLGQVQYVWRAADTDTPGMFNGEFALSRVDGVRVETFPNDGYIEIEVLAAVA